MAGNIKINEKWKGEKGRTYKNKKFGKLEKQN